MEVVANVQFVNQVDVDDLVKLYSENQHTFKIFMNGIVDMFNLDPLLQRESVVYTVKSRMKDPEHLKDKIQRKLDEGRDLTVDNVFDHITDLAGVRVLHLYQDQFEKIHKLIMKMVESNDWYLNEDPVAYSWDPEASDYFNRLGLISKIKPSYYTSIHYVVKPKKDSKVCCEIQVRTLFEEIWGEIDHTINYPHPTKSNSCKEQLRVLSKLVSTGTRLADSIFRSHNDINK